MRGCEKTKRMMMKALSDIHALLSCPLKNVRLFKADIKDYNGGGMILDCKTAADKCSKKPLFPVGTFCSVCATNALLCF